MVFVTDSGIEYSWDEGTEFFIVAWGREYGFKSGSDAWEAYWILDEWRIHVDGVFDKWGYSVEEEYSC